MGATGVVGATVVVGAIVVVVEGAVGAAPPAQPAPGATEDQHEQNERPPIHSVRVLFHELQTVIRVQRGHQTGFVKGSGRGRASCGFRSGR